jgi:hypothetical protein
MATDQLAGLPSAADFADIEVPEFARKYVKRQGPASTKTNPRGRTFSASGPKADLIAKMIFADMGLTRSQMATIAKCSPSRVSEVIWAMEAAVKTGQIEGFPAVPTKPVLDEADEHEDMPEEPADEREPLMPAELASDIQDILDEANGVEGDEQS